MHIEIKYTSDAAQRAYEAASLNEGDAPAQGPAYGSARAGAFDLRAMIDSHIVLLPGAQHSIPVGIALNMMPSYAELDSFFGMAAIILPRSGRGANEGLCIANTIGLIDADFQGEITFTAWARPMTGFINSSRQLAGEPLVIKPGERIGQLMFVPVLRPPMRVVKEFSSTTERGAGGFGSTGNN